MPSVSAVPATHPAAVGVRHCFCPLARRRGRRRGGHPGRDCGAEDNGAGDGQRGEDAEEGADAADVGQRGEDAEEGEDALELGVGRFAVERGYGDGAVWLKRWKGR
jgi:hypothetical protein